MYQVLYRKYRPVDFDSVVGQESIVKTLKNSIINQDFSHSYLFYGPRGVGKTSVSKIFARNINCLNPKDGHLCGKCDNCKNSLSKECIDIIEIDAASNNGVDEIRELKSKILLVPNQLKYKVYIIDEVHMLSIGAFNALLKTLEEPPAHVVFILATTELHKVPETIVSRCQCFQFKKISSSIISDTLAMVCKKEKIKCTKEVLDAISMFCDGGMRDAFGMLDKLRVYANDNIKYDDFILLNGIVTNEQMDLFIDSVLSGDIAGFLNILDEFDKNGKNLIQIMLQLQIRLRNLIVDHYLNGNVLNFLIDLYILFSNLINESISKIKQSDNSRTYLEVLLIMFVNEHVFKAVDNSIVSTGCKKREIDESLINGNLKGDSKVFSEETKPVVIDKKEEARNENCEELTAVVGCEEASVKLVSNTTDNKCSKIVNLDEIIKVRINNVLAKATKEALGFEKNNFDKLKEFSFDSSCGYLICMLLDANIRAASNECVILSYEYDSNVTGALSAISELEALYDKFLNQKKKLAVVLDSEWEMLKNEYIKNKSEGNLYQIIDEPTPIFEENKKNDIITNSAIELFGDIVEME